MIPTVNESIYTIDMLHVPILHATEHLLQIIKDHTGHVELVVECHTCVRSLVVRVVALKYAQ